MQLLERIRKRYSLGFLNFAQFSAVVNDNIFKFIMVFLLIDAYNATNASKILSAAGAIFVVPFLLFSSAAGIMADRYSKKWIITLVKIFEVVLFTAAFFVVQTKNAYGLYLLLFCLATHSAIFGPAKYSIIPELVPVENVPKANGLITSCTYLGIIIGTFLASFLCEVTGCNYPIIMVFCWFLALTGLLNALCIPTTPHQGSTRKIHPFFIKEILHTLRNCQSVPHLVIVLASSSFFLFVGSFTQLNIIPYSLQALHLSEIYGGYLFLCTALGIAVGSLMVGKFLKKPISLWIPCSIGFALAFFLALLALIHYPPIVIGLLFMLGIAGGMFVVPLDSYVQIACSNETRGQVIAVGNFLGFCGVLLSSFLLYAMSTLIHLSAMQGFGVMSLLTLLYTLFIFFRLSQFTLPRLIKRLLHPTFNLNISDLSILEPKGQMPLVLYGGTPQQCLMLLALLPQYQFIFVNYKKNATMRFLCLFSSFQVFKKDRHLLKTGRALCYVLPEKQAFSILDSKHAQVEIREPMEKDGAFQVRFLLVK
jgi:acyl-[acyl-carrier-protein]-phospholipid O-acyltransferase / long-chain-fatty-acid--[acyl-carrier-protein] ligase